MSSPPNVVLLVLDSVRYDAIGSDGEGFAQTPFLDEFGNENLSFSRAYAPAPWTVPSHASMFTGVYPSEHQTSHGGKKYLNPNYPTLAEQLRDAGYHTELYTNNVHLVPEFGFTRGFTDLTRGPLVSNESNLIDWNEFIENRDNDSGIGKYLEIIQHIIENKDKNLIKSIRSGIKMKAQHHRGDSGAKDAINHFEERSVPDDKPTFTFINLMEAHNPFNPPKQFRDYEPLEIAGWEYELGEESLSEEDLKALRSLYRGEIEYLDQVVRQLYNSLADENTIFIVTSDHGVSLGEHQKLYHGSCLHDTTIHVPLMIDGVGRTDNLNIPVGIISLYKTLLDIANVKVPAHARGTNLLDPVEERILAEMMGSDDWLERHARKNHNKQKVKMVTSTRRALVCKDSKLIRNEDTGDTELYDVVGDPHETKLIDDADRSQHLEQKLDNIIENFKTRDNTGEQEQLNAQTKDKLKDLGYLK